MTDVSQMDASIDTLRERSHSVGALVLEPPLAIDITDLEKREKRLTDVIANEVIPRLLISNRSILASDTGHADQNDIAQLARLVVGPDNSDALDYIYQLRDRGLSLDLLHTELLEPTARYLGDLWTNDTLDFFDVTIGVNKLQRLVDQFASLDQVQPYNDKRRALIIVTPGEQHSFGNAMVQKFLRAAGWYVSTTMLSHADQIAPILAEEWFDVIGISLSGEGYLESMKSTIKHARASSLNKQMRIMVGGPAFLEHPEWVQTVDADGTASNAPTAVILAMKLLAESALNSK